MLVEMEIGKRIETLTKQRKGVKRYRGYYVSLYGQYLRIQMGLIENRGEFRNRILSGV